MLLLIEVEGVDYLGLERWWVNGTRMVVSSYLSDTRHDAKSSRESTWTRYDAMLCGGKRVGSKQADASKVKSSRADASRTFYRLPSHSHSSSIYNFIRSFHVLSNPASRSFVHLSQVDVAALFAMSFFECVPLVRVQSMLHCGGGDNFYTLDDVFNTEEERKTKMVIYRLQDVTRGYG